jgi:hypothetical protein
LSSRERGGDALADATKIMSIRGDWDRFELRAGRETIKKHIARGQRSLLALQPRLQRLLVGPSPRERQ